jgi:hypothetical protein
MKRTFKPFASMLMTIREFRSLYFAAYLLLGAGLWSSCTGGAASGRSSDIHFDSIVVQQQIPLLQTSDTTLPFAEIRIAFTYPSKFRNQESLFRLQKIFQGTFFGDRQYDSIPPGEAVKKFVEDYSQRYRSLSNAYYEDKNRLKGEMPVWYWYYMNNSNKILFQNESILSYAVTYNDYEGGAHGSHRITYTNIDLNELVTLSEEDLFVPDYYKPLREKIVQGLMHSYRVNEPDSLLDKGFFTIEDIVPNNNFWLNNEGIHYSYNQYEIAPYSMGVIDVAIPYTDLQDILLPGGVISRYFLSEK